jgi:hypothetical protein
MMLFEQNAELLLSIIESEPNVSLKHCQLRFLLESRTIGTGSQLIPLLRKMKQENRITYADFRAEYLDMLDSVARTTPQKRYTLIFVLNIAFKNKIKATIDNELFKIISYREVASKLINLDRLLAEKQDDLLTKVGLKTTKEAFKPPYSFFVMDVYARNVAFALDFFGKKLQYALGLLLFSRYRSKVSFALGAPKKISELALGYGVILEEGKFNNYAFFNEEIHAVSEDFNEADWDKFTEYLRACQRIRKKAPDIAQIIYQALKSYYEASVEKDPAHSFFKYWVCVEFCFLKSENISEKKLVQRIKTVISSDDKYFKYSIERLYDKRNSFVHKLDMDVSEFERNRIKALADISLSSIMGEATQFSSKKELGLFYDYMQDDLATLKAARKMAQKVIKTRKS